ncbi:MAG TPA: signal peptidase II [candidate division Zixibacteria bacterium]|nr:signal peptidase II [candidate division Zixibacteria bacterium]MDD4917317.1 signal peptidase II [candidate division Zixibacteria bacterium]MDM7971535.1 signal peptidase II [candidate division Zixibacteria bacterium]HOD65471.1 signal peptidase II [candidate division Zixibacteria bacterium]HPM36753.1 signal peptidase II [candidate division Zixibacteria bacterium]
MAAGSSRRLTAPALVILLVAAADQATKFWAVQTLPLREPVAVLGSFVQFTLVYNEGGALGTRLASSSYYLITSLIILGIVLYYLFANRGAARVCYPLAFIAGGALGNIIDRIRIGQVIDFIDIDFFDIHLAGYELERWWTFNIADAAISVSIVYLLASVFLHQPARDPRRLTESGSESA